VLCEGERTEPDYINALSRQHDVREIAAVRINLDHGSFGSVPMTLVRRAVALRRRSIEENDEIDEVWCVFDVEWPGSGENHPGLREAVHLARANGVHVAVSNPSFELWLILHFRDQYRFVANAEVKRIRAECDGSTGKGVDGAIYMQKRADAARRAVRLDEKHDGDGTKFPANNPSSGMHLLLASIATPNPL
jgi:sugar/nucleoside kinase (ribokinase family)